MLSWLFALLFTVLVRSANINMSIYLEHADAKGRSFGLEVQCVFEVLFENLE